ncbi:hypothetical protein DIRU0_B10264 [Diutina rugosa]
MQRILNRFRNNESGEFQGRSSKNYPFVPVALVEGLFKQKMLEFTKFQSKFCFSDDNEWVFVVSKFVTGRGKVMGILCFKGKDKSLCAHEKY